MWYRTARLSPVCRSLRAASVSSQGDGHLFTNGNVILGNADADLITVNGVIQGASPLVFEGATVDASETTFAITDPTADRTITFPDQSGTVVLATSGLNNGRIPYTASTQLTDSADMAYVDVDGRGPQ